MDAEPFRHLIDDLNGTQPPRVWSLLVTVFGELAQAPEAAISGTLLGALTQPIGIKPEAMRVALHRLRKDGWIDNRKTGRTSAHFLTEWGRAQSAAATPLIYATAPLSDAAWVILTDPAKPAGVQQIAGAWISSNTAIVAHPPNDSQTLGARLDPDNPVPDWVSRGVCPSDLATQSRHLAARLTDVQRALAGAEPLTAVQIAALRVLIVHSWRRITLKLPVLPDFVFGPDWQGGPCRALVAALLDSLPKQELSDLERGVTG